MRSLEELTIAGDPAIDLIRRWVDRHPAVGAVLVPLRRPMQEDTSYVCDACGEEIVIPLDPSQGSNQEYVEDCPVCCRPNVIHVEIDEDGQVRAWANPE